ncbi:MAG: hypothetical protein LBJ14_08920 [Desulfarculales bacterium]|nr:hypothetical protein [Desulfarculales bacterium]
MVFKPPERPENAMLASGDVLAAVMAGVLAGWRSVKNKNHIFPRFKFKKLLYPAVVEIETIGKGDGLGLVHSHTGKKGT